MYICTHKAVGSHRSLLTFFYGRRFWLKHNYIKTHKVTLLFLPSAAWRWIMQGQSALAIVNDVIHTHYNYFENELFVSIFKKIHSKSNQL